MQLKKRTPCVGICSTTYGDLVCRGCKRFAHEIVQWNGYDEAQQDAVRGRLQQVRHDVLGLLVRCDNEGLLRQALIDTGLQDLPALDAQYELMRFMVRRDQPLARVGLAITAEPSVDAQSAERGAEGLDTLRLLQLIDTECFERAKAHYERNFKVPA
ncbi:MAG: DUF1289 domain-containing protein [Proteobacteria bacterium]|nr:DUF1289 domain-containing protein [Pseudomonadota bacterium]